MYVVIQKQDHKKITQKGQEKGHSLIATGTPEDIRLEENAQTRLLKRVKKTGAKHAEPAKKVRKNIW